ncbi:AAA domain protein [Rhodococcus sp. MTM3W5.2]|uniref:AAA family ATPase n=1 Tax=Rhodococcus sp. MTM3W5.2 TaxID=1805827 RepID=UPI0009797531|nr:AAA family ATPase [Rhodococcus sp. MTM3W5.2]AQA22115.1 AAA domain protein [Rhodococcus sp. MTM3W5.2]
MTIESDIIEWALQRPGWQQDVLVALANGEAYDSKRIEQLVDDILAGTNIEPSQEAKGISVKSPDIEQVQLIAIADLNGVNALADGQRLDFATNGLTIVYGDNGSGKSGYARLIKATVSARHRSAVLPNVFSEAPAEPSGVLHFSVAGVERQQAVLASPPPEFLRMSFFDEHCGDEYLTKESTISYRPSALNLLDGLIQICDSARSEIAARIKTNESTALRLDVPPTTTSGAFLATLTASTTEAQVDAATALTDGTNARLATVLQEESRLTSSNPQREKTRLTTLAKQVKSLAQDLNLLIRALDSEATDSRAKLRSDAMSARAAASVAAANSFDDEPLVGVGSETWRALWNTARAYSVTEAYHSHDFPATGDAAVCVLCQQDLDVSAKERLRRFEQYMADTTERDAVAAERSYEEAMEELRSLEVATPVRTSALTALEAHSASLCDTATALLTKIEEQRDAVVRHLTTDEAAPTPIPEVDLPEKLITLAEELERQATATDLSQFQATLSAATKEKTELQASVRLSESAARVKAETGRLRDLMGLKQARSAADTSSITQKAASLTREYATDRIVDQFTRETDRLRLQKVTLQDLGGRKGQLNQKPGLLGATRGITAPSVLSEGEQTALGLAGFFTEAVFDESRSAIIFDDPVTSLDHVRRDKVAERLAQLARDRQVVVFTHDVAFTGDLTAAADSEGVALTERAVERRGIEPGICIKAFPWKAKDFASRIDHLKVELAKLTKERPNLVQDEWEEKVASWAGRLSEAWERSVTTEIMNQVFDRGSSQVRMLKFRILTKITEADNQDLQEGYGATSKWGRRHDKAAETNYVAPEPADLERELTRLTEWQKRIKRYL